MGHRNAAGAEEPENPDGFLFSLILFEIRQIEELCSSPVSSLLRFDKSKILVGNILSHPPFLSATVDFPKSVKRFF